jgi:hypothetical protein
LPQFFAGSRSPVPAYARHSRILDHCDLVLQTRYAFTSVTQQIPVVFTASVTKKPHIKVNDR